MKNKRKRLPAWYRLMLERRLKILELALKHLDHADKCIKLDYPISAKTCINLAKKYL